MKYFIAIALIAAVASAGVVKPRFESEEIQQIVAAIQSPSTDPATAAALEAMLLDVMGVTPVQVGPAIIESNPISVGPAIVETNPISVGPAIVDFPLPDGGAVTAVETNPIAVLEPVQPSPVIIGEIPAGQTPLVQIIVNVNKPESVVAPAPVVLPVIEPVVPGPVNIVDHVVAPVISPVQVVAPVVPGPVNVVDHVVAPVVSPVQVVQPVAPGPVNVVNTPVVSPVQVAEPIVVSPVQVGVPIIPSPAVVLPETLN